MVGDTPTVVDPAAGPLTPPQALLLSNVAQGLVRFDADGNIVGGLAERWNVSDDGLLYIFRLRSGEWPGGRKIVAEDVARLLRREIARSSRNSLKDTAGAVTQVLAMTDRVLAIQLFAPRPHLLQLLAQPEFAIVRGKQGSGPFTLATEGKWLQLSRALPNGEDEEPQVERVELEKRTVRLDSQGAVAQRFGVAQCLEKLEKELRAQLERIRDQVGLEPATSRDAAEHHPRDPTKAEEP